MICARVIIRIILVILVIFLAWTIWFHYQYFTKSRTANMLLKQKVKELGGVDFDVLLQKIGKDYEYKEVEIDGKKYWMGWIIVQPDSLSKFIAFHIGKPRLKSPPRNLAGQSPLAPYFERGKPHTGAEQENRPAGDINVLKACVYVDYISLLPFGYFKMGSSWILTVTLEIA